MGQQKAVIFLVWIMNWNKSAQTKKFYTKILKLTLKSKNEINTLK